MSVNGLLKYRRIKFVRVLTKHLIGLLGVILPPSVKLGKNVSFRHNAVGTVIHSNVEIEDNVKIYQNVTIGRADINVSPAESKFKGVLIKEGAILAAGAKILCKEGVLVVGKNSIVAANAVLLNSIGDNEIWGGIPARKIGVVSTEKHQLEHTAN